MNKKKATLIGMSAILLWSTMVGLVRAISVELGPVGGAATIYSASAVLMFFIAGIPKFDSFPRKYLYAGGLLFVLYEICLALSLGYAHNSRQAIEVAMLNYLWPSMTILFAIIFNRQKANLLIIPGLLLSLFGVCWVLSGDRGFHPGEILVNLRSNPLSYFLAFSASLLWAAYCTVTVKTSQGKTGTTLFLAFTALALWIKFFLGTNPPMHVDWTVAVYVAMAAIAVGLGFAAWNIGIIHGNLAMLATASYFTPVFSAVLASLLLKTPLSFYFWKGAFMVCLGSLLSWISTRDRSTKRQDPGLSNT